ncbi:hypothetical protein [Phaffia rhodozyma]|uniref:Uncharacterized protein n=1 Tax=Phaffia rhodozyma TaxID=264483 RepID=A0A0F7SPN4_PHARH|nr:hypothetical protein [Phaffia rhodozyma]
MIVSGRERELDAADLRSTTIHDNDGEEEFMVSPTPGSRSSSPVEVILLDTSSSDNEQSEPRNLTDHTSRSGPQSYINSPSDPEAWSYQDDFLLNLSDHEEDTSSFFSILSRAFSSGSLRWQTLESFYGSGLRGALSRTWAPAEGRRRLRSDYRTDSGEDVVPHHQQIEHIFESPVVFKREDTRKGFARSFELDIGGFIDSSNEDEEVENTRLSPSVAPKLHLSQGDSNSLDRPSPTERSSSQDSIYVVESDGIERSLPSGPASSSDQASSSHATTATLPEGIRRPLQPQGQKRRPPRIQQYGLSFGCSSCLRPLLQRASSSDRKIYVLSCGHLIDGYCLVRLCAHPDSTFPFVYPSSSAAESPEGSAKDKKKQKSKIKPPRIPVKSRSYEWFCPVEGCERPHQSTLDVLVDEQSDEVGMFLEGPQWYWRPLMGGVEGVRLLFI